jgi:hypothetical protein
VERLTLIPGQLQTLAIILARADELPGTMARCSCRLDAARLRDEQTAIGDQLRAAIDAAAAHVTTAAGGQDAVRSFPFARRHLEELAMHRTMPTSASTAGRLVFIRSAWMALNVAMASLDEIRFDARQGQNLI